MENNKYSAHDLVMKRPASAFSHRWLDATPIGNGETGVLFYGGVAAEHLVINRSDMWYDGEDAPVPNVSSCVSEMRALQQQGKYREANDVMYEALRRENYGTRLADMRVLGDVKLTFSCLGVYSRYRRVLHMDTAEAEVFYDLGKAAYRRRYFVSRKRDIVVMEICSEEKTNFSLRSGFFETREGRRELKVRESDAAAAAYRTDGNCYIYSSANAGKYFGIVSRVISDGEVNVEESGISVKNTSRSLVLVKAFSEAENREAAENLAVSSLKACPESYAELFEENLPLYQALYKTADLTLYAGETYHSNAELLTEAKDGELSVELAEKLWRFGRYLFISGTTQTGLPFPLYGVWPYGYECMFTHHVANENVQSIYWHTDVGGLSALVPPLIKYYYDRMDKFRENARQLYGCRGIFVGTYTTPKNAAVAWFVPVILHFCGVAGWLSSHFYRYYLFTGDETLLKEKILPFMLEAAEFYEDYHYLDEKGNFSLYPAVSPENSPMEYYNKALPHSMPVTKNPTIEIAIVKELLQNLITLSKAHPELSVKVPTWEKMLSAIPAYRVNKDGAIAEWMDENLSDAYDHRHVSHLYPIFPGTELEDAQEKELIAACKRAVDLRENGSFCGWSMPHMSAIYSRLRETEKAFDTMNALTKVCVLDNFFTLGYDYRDMGITGFICGSEFQAKVQLDALLGYVNALQEMLIFTSPKILRLLPACPKQFGKGSATFRFATGIVEMRWNAEEKQCHGTITALRPTNVSLELPFEEGKKELKLKKGEKYSF